MYVKVKDGVVVGVEGDPDHPINQGRLCTRCLTLPDFLYHKDRITSPLKRASSALHIRIIFFALLRYKPILRI